MSHSLVPVFWPLQHECHAPETEYDNGALIAYADVPDRIDALKTALAALPFVRLEAAATLPTEADLTPVHTPALLHYLHAASESQREMNGRYAYPSVFPGHIAHTPGMNAKKLMGGMWAFDVHAPIGGGTVTAVYHSAAAALAAAEAILSRKSRLAYALCRPPGHHAGRAFTGGYCYLNNAALAAHRLSTMGKGAILDIDYHHGNGTQDITWNDPHIFFASLHADPAFEYPYYTGYANETGSENAPETTANFPLPAGTDDAAYLHALEKALTAIHAFAPNWLVVSLGYDTYGGDPLSTFTLSDTVFTEIGSRINSLNLPTLLVQEGGYQVNMIGVLAQNTVNGFLAPP